MIVRNWSAGLAGALAIMAAPAVAQSIGGLDPVKVKTIPMGPKDTASSLSYRKFPAAVAPLPSSATLSSAMPMVPVIKVKTFRVDRGGHMLDKADVGAPSP